MTTYPKPALLKGDGLFPCAVTGHRRLGARDAYNPTNPTSLRVKELLYEEVARTIADLPVDIEFIGISGMALGVDQLYAEVCIDLDLPWIAYIPCVRQYSRWPAPAQARYKTLAGTADLCWLPNGSIPYTSGCMQSRNEAMVRDCDRLLAVWNGRAGGTGNCVWTAATEIIRPIRILDPDELDAGWSTYTLPQHVIDAIGVPHASAAEETEG